MQSLRIFAKQLGHDYQDLTKLQLALTHRSMSATKANNERLEFLGDSIVNFVIAEALYHKFPQAKEGQLSRLRAQLVCKKSLAEIAQSLKIKEHLVLSPAELRTGGANKESIQADAVEAIVGSIFLDANFEQAKACILSWFAQKLAEITLAAEKDPKTKLQEHLQKFKQPLPIYELVCVHGDAPNQEFTVECRIDTLPEPAIGVATNRRKAEFAAAKIALEKLNG